MSRPTLLDLFARAQGTSVGYARAGFRVTASDIDPYPLHHEVHSWITADALDILDDVEFCRRFDLIAASPPCQGYSNSRHLTGRTHPMLIEPVLERLEKIGKPYVVENVESKLVKDAFDNDYIRLCGSMFGLGAFCHDGVYRQLRRHRLFKLGGWDLTPPECDHYGQPGGVYGHSGSSERQKGYQLRTRTATMGVYGHGRQTPSRPGGKTKRGYGGDKGESQTAMGIHWMRRDDLTQAIPPAYTKYIGREFLAVL